MPTSKSLEHPPSRINKCMVNNTKHKVDVHTNLGWFPTSRSSANRIECNVQEMADFLNLNGVTCNVVLYPRDGYAMLKELADLTPNIHHIGLQVLMGADALIAEEYAQYGFLCEEDFDDLCPWG